MELAEDLLVKGVRPDQLATAKGLVFGVWAEMVLDSLGPSKQNESKDRPRFASMFEKIRLGAGHVRLQDLAVMQAADEVDVVAGDDACLECPVELRELVDENARLVESPPACCSRQSSACGESGGSASESARFVRMS